LLNPDGETKRVSTQDLCESEIDRKCGIKPSNKYNKNIKNLTWFSHNPDLHLPSKREKLSLINKKKTCNSLSKLQQA